MRLPFYPFSHNRNAHVTESYKIHRNSWIFKSSLIDIILQLVVSNVNEWNKILQPIFKEKYEKSITQWYEKVSPIVLLQNIIREKETQQTLIFGKWTSLKASCLISLTLFLQCDSTINTYNANASMLFTMLLINYYRLLLKKKIKKKKNTGSGDNDGRIQTGISFWKEWLTGGSQNCKS